MCSGTNMANVWGHMATTTPPIISRAEARPPYAGTVPQTGHTLRCCELRLSSMLHVLVICSIMQPSNSVQCSGDILLGICSRRI